MTPKEFKPLNADELVTLTNKRIGELTFIDLTRAIEAMEDNTLYRNNLLLAIRNREFEDIGKILSEWVSIYHQADIELNGGL